MHDRLFALVAAFLLPGCLVVVTPDDDDSVADDDDSVVDDDDSVADDDDSVAPFPDPTAWYRVHNAADGLFGCIETWDGNGPSAMDFCGNFSGQSIFFREVEGAEGWTIHSDFQGEDRCLDAGDPSSDTLQGAAHIADCDGSDRQVWLLEGEGESRRLKTPHYGTGSCLDANLSGAEHGGGLFLAACDGGPAQDWTLVEYGDPEPKRLTGHQVVLGTGTAPADDTPRAACPDGKVVIAGGGDWGEGLALSSMGPRNSRRAWGFEGGLVSSSAPFTVAAVCVDRFSLPGYQEVWQEGTHPTGGQILSAACPIGKTLMGGGKDWDASAIALDVDRPYSVSEWVIAGFAPAGTSGTWSVTALCGDTSALPGVTYVREEGTHPGGDAWIEVECPAGQIVLGGGGYWGGAVTRTASLPRSATSWGQRGTTSSTNAEWWVDALCVDAP